MREDSLVFNARDGLGHESSNHACYCSMAPTEDKHYDKWLPMQATTVTAMDRKNIEIHKMHHFVLAAGNITCINVVPINLNILRSQSRSSKSCIGIWANYDYGK